MSKIELFFAHESCIHKDADVVVDMYMMAVMPQIIQVQQCCVRLYLTVIFEWRMRMY